MNIENELKNLGSRMIDSIERAGITTDKNKLLSSFRCKYPQHANADSPDTMSLYLLESKALNNYKKASIIMNIHTQLQQFLMKTIGNNFLQQCLDVIRTNQDVYFLGDVLHTYLTVNELTERHKKKIQFKEISHSLSEQIKIFLENCLLDHTLTVDYIREFFKNSDDNYIIYDEVPEILFKELFQLYDQHVTFLQNIKKIKDILPVEIIKYIDSDISSHYNEEIRFLLAKADKNSKYIEFDIEEQNTPYFQRIYNKDNSYHQITTFLKFLSYCDKIFADLNIESLKNLCFKEETHTLNQQDAQVQKTVVYIYVPLLIRIYNFIRHINENISKSVTYGKKNLSNYHIMNYINCTKHQNIRDVMCDLQKTSQYKEFYENFNLRISRILSHIMIYNKQNKKK